MTPHVHSRASDSEASTQFRLGENSAAITLMLASQKRMETDIAEIKETLSIHKGERKATVYAAGGLGSLMMFILAVIGAKLGWTT
jgi:hypothetical protein